MGCRASLSYYNQPVYSYVCQGPSIKQSSDSCALGSCQTNYSSHFIFGGVAAQRDEIFTRNKSADRRVDHQRTNNKRSETSVLTTKKRHNIVDLNGGGDFHDL